MPILGTILITAREDGTVDVRATDLETTLERTVSGATVIEAGSAAVPAKLLSAYLDRLPPGAATLSSDQTHATVTAGKAHVTLNAFPAEEFPVAPDKTGSFEITLSGSKIKDCVRATEFAASTEESRGAVLMGLYLVSAEGRLAMVGTDGYKLAHRSIIVEDGNEAERTLILPAKAMAEVARNVGTATEVKMTVLGKNDNQVRFECPEAAITVRCVDGQYPNYRQVIPQGPGLIATVKVADLVGALRRARIIANERANAVNLRVSTDSIAISVNSATSGSANEDIEISGWTGEPIEISFNSQFMLDALDRMDSEIVEIQLGGPVAPAIMRPTGDTEGSDHFVILMPLRN